MKDKLRQLLALLLALSVSISLLVANALAAEQPEKEKAVAAETEGASCYTVEFTYHEKQYVMQGNTTVALSDILDYVGHTGEVTAVEVSDSTLFSASKESGEWMVTAHQAFSSTEWMKVTIDGVMFEIVVTDRNQIYTETATVSGEIVNDTFVCNGSTYDITLPNDTRTIISAVCNDNASDPGSHSSIQGGNAKISSNGKLTLNSSNTYELNGYNAWKVGWLKDDWTGYYIFVRVNVYASASATPASGLVANGTTQNLLTNCSATNGTMNYSTDGTNWSTSIPTGTAAGDYTVYYKAVGTNGYKDSGVTGPLTVTITEPPKASVSKAPTAKTLTYNGNEQELVTAGTASNGQMQYSLTSGSGYSTSIPKGKEAKTYTVYYKAVGTNGYGDSERGSVNVTIVPKEIGLTWGTTTFTYDGHSHAPTATATGIVGSDTCTITVTGAQTNTGSHTATASSLSNTNYKLPSAKTKSFTINPKAVTATIETISNQTYVGAKIEPAITVRDGTTTIPASEYEVSYSDNKNVGTATVTLTDKPGGNYTVSGSTTFEITKAPLTVTAKNKTITYGDAPSNDGVSYSGFVGGETETEFGGTLDYEYDYPQYGNQGTYSITPKGLTSANYNITFRNGTLTVRPKELTITALPQTVTYGTDIARTATQVTGNALVGNETIESVTLAASTTAATNGTPGTITPSAVKIVKADGTTDSTANYTLSYQTGALTIGRKAVTVGGITAENKTYDGNTNATLNFTNASFEGKLDSDTLTVSATGTFADKKVGQDKNVTISDLALGGAAEGNYTLAATGQQESTTANITAKQVTVSGITAKDKTYDGNTSATLDYGNVSLAGRVGTDDLSVTATGNFEDKNAGTGKTVSITDLALGGDEAGNYVLAQDGHQASSTADISQAAITITADDQSSAYKADLAELTYRVGGAYVSGDDLDVSLSTDASNTAKEGAYPITVSWNNNPNYTATLTDGTYTITKDGATATASGYSGIYDGKAHGITVEVKKGLLDLLSELFGGEPEAKVYYSTEELTPDNYASVGSTESPAYTNVGEHTVYYFVESGNYESDPTAGSQTVTIGKAPLTVTTEDQAIIYGEAPAEFSVTCEGFADGENESRLGGGLDYACGYRPGNDVGEYTITPSGLTSDNYEIAFVDGRLTVTAKELNRSALAVEPERVSATGSTTGPEIIIKDGDKVLEEGKDYVLSGDVTSDKFGTHVVMVTLRGNYAGEFDTSWELIDEDNYSESDANISVSVHVADGTPKTNVDNLTLGLAKELLSADELARYENGENVRVYLEVKALGEPEVPASDKGAAEAKAEELGGEVGAYLDLSLWMKVGNAKAHQIHDTKGDKIQVTVTIPDSLRNTNASVARTFYIIRVHDGETAVVSSGDGTTITFETDQFSTYALSYADEEIKVNKPNDTKPVDTKTGEPQKDGTKPGETKTGAPQKDDTKTGETKTGAPQKDDTKTGEPQKDDTETGETKTGAPQKDEPQKGDTEKDTAKKNNTKTGTAKKSSGRKGIPNTGDVTMPGAWLTPAGASAAGLGALALGGRKRKSDDGKAGRRLKR